MNRLGRKRCSFGATYHSSEKYLERRRCSAIRNCVSSKIGVFGEQHRYRRPPAQLTKSAIDKITVSAGAHRPKSRERFAAEAIDKSELSHPRAAACSRQGSHAVCDQTAMFSLRPHAHRSSSSALCPASEHSAGKSAMSLPCHYVERITVSCIDKPMKRLGGLSSE